MKLKNIIILTLLVSVFISCKSKTESAKANVDTDRKWWKEAVVYQVYPRSFKDSDGDGIGDLKGIISKLDYIKSLGVDVVWLNPIYSSPNDDNGYDVSDYRDIMKDFGSMEDFEALLRGMHERGIKLVMDVVVNHSSDEHEWFKQSRSSRDNPYRDYYHWWNAERGKPNYRYSLFDINHDAWMYDSVTNAYYLHYFSRKQPDLNWENPKLRQEIYDMMRFWADKGVDGFRLDAFQFVAKDTTFPAFPQGFEKDFIKYYAMQDGLHDYLKEMYSEVFSKYDVMSVAEGAGRNFQDAHHLVDADRKELNMAYAFDAVDIAKRAGYSVLKLKEVFGKWDSAFAEKGWISIFLANHDQARLVSRFGNDSPEFRELSSKMLNTFILSMRGTPYCYYGDELGMTNAGFTKIEDYQDKATLSEYQHQKNIGADISTFMANLQFGARDNGRTPMQWDATANAGFGAGVPWIRVNSNYRSINAAKQESEKNSCLNYFRKMVKLRKNNEALVYGKYTIIDRDNPDVYAYAREQNGNKFLIVLNFRNKTTSFNPGVKLDKAEVLISNYENASRSGTLKPYEAIIFKL
ncbi:MAG TPA: alpha-glucosidase [Chitinophagaceae bacterium]|nr:alpha-glucosidase [Chitinophagaceae bacterium]